MVSVMALFPLTFAKISSSFVGQWEVNRGDRHLYLRWNHWFINLYRLGDDSTVFVVHQGDILIYLLNRRIVQVNVTIQLGLQTLLLVEW